MDWPKIQHVEPIDGFRLRVRFRNGELRVYDCRPLLEASEFASLRDEVFFRAVRTDPGGYGVSWNDSIDLSESELWLNGILVAEESTRT